VRLPFALKGVDVVIYTVFRSLGLEVEIRPVLGDPPPRDYDAEDDEGDDLVGTKLHDIQLSEDGDDEKMGIEVRPDPGASSHQYSPYW
jgi:hypothetical protein